MSKHRGFRYRLYPTTAQDEALTRWAGCARAVWNAALEQRSFAWRVQRRSVFYGAQAHELVEARRELPWLAEPHIDVLQTAMRDLDRAFEAFFDGHIGYPHFRVKGRRGSSFRIHDRGRKGPILVRRLNRRWGELRVPKLGWVRFRWSREPRGRIKHVTITADRLGWHASLCCAGQHPEYGHPALPPVGVDRGVVATLALSTGQTHHTPRLPPGQQERLCRLERRAGRQETARRRRSTRERRRSKRHERTLAAIAGLRAREARIRKNFLHETSTELAKSHGLLVLEDLAVTAMTRSARGTIEAPGKNVRAKAGLNRAILAQGWGEFARHLEYKAPGRVVYVPAHNTSRRCHRCGNVATENRLTRRSFVCTRCGYAGDADVNAAQNILAAGLGRNSARSPLRRHGTEARTPRLAGLDVAA